MSCHHFIRCLDCKEDEGSLYLNWGEKPLTNLLQHLLSCPQILAFDSDWDLELGITCRYQSADLGWFKTHQAHKIAVVDEYGYLKPCACGKEHSGSCGLTVKYEV